MNLSVVLGTSIFVLGMALLVSRAFRLLVGLSGLCAAALGVWLLAPLWLDAHRLVPIGAGEWIRIDTFLFTTFFLGGTILAMVLLWPVALVTFRQRSRFQLSPLSAIALLAFVLPLGFVGLGALLEWTIFPRTHRFQTLLDSTIPPVLATLPIAIGLALAARTLRAKKVHARIASVGVGAIAALGFGALPFRLPEAQDLELQVPKLSRSKAGAAPLLFIGIDAGTWRVFRPLIDQGRAPTFARLMREGVHGQVNGEWPYWSGPAWGAILTGHSKESLGLHEDLSAEVPGLPRFQIPLAADLRLNALSLIQATLVSEGLMTIEPFPRAVLRVPPLWERLHEAGTRMAVVRFPYTYPATGQAAHVVSFKVVSDFWDMLGVKSGDPTLLVSSSTNVPGLRDLFVDGPRIDPQLFDGVLPRPDWPQPDNTVLNPSLVLGEVLTTAHRTFEATRQLLSSDRNLDGLMLYLGEFDVVAHALWPYKFPDDFPPELARPPDVEVLGPVFDNFVVDLDKHLAEILSAFPVTPNVLIVSDHGAAASHVATIWHGWHAAEGMFLASGPDIQPDSQFLSLSYSEIAPTILDLLGFEKPEDMVGQSVLQLR